MVNKIERDFDNGIIKVLLIEPVKRSRKKTDILNIFDNRNGKITKNKIAIRVTDNFVWVYETKHRETLYKKEFKKGDINERETALITAKSVFDRYMVRT